MRAALGAVLHLVLRGGHDQAVAAMQAVLGEDGFATAWAQGQAVNLEDAMTFAVAGPEVPH